MADHISAELAATCEALGYYDGHKYHLDKHCLDVIKDLIKYLKRDDDIHTVRRYLGQTKLLQTDLIKILIEYPEKYELWDVLLRLIINLTSSASIIFNEQMPTDKTMCSIYQEITIFQQTSKVVMTDERVWTAIKCRLEKIFILEPFERGEEREMTIDRILILIRNVLQIPPDDNEKRADNDATIHDQVLFALHSSQIVDILLYVATNHNEQQYHIQVLEIISLMFQEQNASNLASAGLQRCTVEKEKDEALLLSVRQKEIQEKMDKMKKYAGSRHSQFGGTYVVTNMKAIGENQLICHKPFKNIESVEFGLEKKILKRPKNKRAMMDISRERTSALSVRLFLKEFCVEFLIGAYNPIMRYARSCVVSGSHEILSDPTCYLWALRFFMEFNRHYNFQVKYVSETISTEVFHLVQRQMEQFYEMMVTDKKKIPIWSRRLHTALKAYQELLLTLLEMDKSSDQGVRDSSKVIKSNIFYVPEYRETILCQLLNFDEVKMSRKYLADLVTTTHIFLKMLEHSCSKGHRSLVVQKVKHKKKTKSQKKKEKPKAPLPSLDELWDDTGPELSAVMREGVIPEVVPFDAASDKAIDDQKEDAMKKIQRLLRQKQLEQATGLFRSAREVWPENDCFGRAGIPVEEEFLALREIFFADLGVTDEADPVEDVRIESENMENTLNHEPEYDEDDDDEEDEEAERTSVMETEFKFNEFMQRFANVRMVRALALLLQQFDKNTPEVNHYITKLLHRIAWDCKMPGMIFQASIFRIFQRILESKRPDHKELQKFAVFIIRRFTEVAQKNRKSYMELLFWKSTRDATEVIDGYGTAEPNKKVSRALWTETEEDELRTLFMEHQTNKYSQDLIDWLLENIINKDRTRRGIMKKLKEMFLIVNSKAVRSEIQKRLPKEWAEDEIAQLTQLWEELKDDDDPIGLIYNGLRIKRPQPKIKEKLLELGLAKDRKELRKKRSRKNNHGKSSWETQSVGNSDDDRDSDEESEKSSGHAIAVAGKSRKKDSRKKSSRKQPTIVYSDAQLSGLLKDVIDKNMSDALEWVKESLEDAVEDRDEENVEGIPLVPLTDNSLTAMDSPNFQKLLLAMGISPPADEQEVYWRIPAQILTSTIKKRCDLISNALEGKFVMEEPLPSTSRSISNNDKGSSDSSDDEDVLENVKKFFTPKAPISQTSEDSEINNRAKPPKVTKPKVLKKNLKTRKGANSWEDANNSETDSTDKKKAGSRLRAVVVSSDSEMEINDVYSTNDEEESKRNRSDNSDIENPTKKKRRFLDSDEEDEEPLAEDTQPQAKANRNNISDEEETDELENNKHSLH